MNENLGNGPTRREFDRFERNLEKQAGCLDRVEKRLVDIESREQSRDAVARQIAADVQKHGQEQITTRTFVLGTVGVVVAVGGLFLAVSPPA